MDGVGQHEGAGAGRQLRPDHGFTEPDCEEQRRDVQTAAEEEETGVRMRSRESWVTARTAVVG